MLKLMMTVSGGAGARITIQPAPDNTNGKPMIKELLDHGEHEFYINGSETFTIEELSKAGLAMRRPADALQPDEDETDEEREEREYEEALERERQDAINQTPPEPVDPSAPPAPPEPPPAA